MDYWGSSRDLMRTNEGRDSNGTHMKSLGYFQRQQFLGTHKILYCSAANTELTLFKR